MNYKSKLSTTGKLLFNQLYKDEIKKPNKGCIKNLIHNLFTSNYDLELERLEKAMYGSSQKLYEYIFDHLKLKECNKKAIYNLNADQRENKYDSSQNLIEADINEMPSYVVSNIEKYKDWIV